MQDDLKSISEELDKFNSESAKIVKQNHEFCIIGKNGHNFGCYKNEKDAINRLKHVVKQQFDMGEKTEAYVKKVGPPDKPYCVITEQTGKNMGCYKTKKEAEDRLVQIKRFA